RVPDLFPDARRLRFLARVMSTHAAMASNGPANEDSNDSARLVGPKRPKGSTCAGRSLHLGGVWLHRALVPSTACQHPTMKRAWLLLLALGFARAEDSLDVTTYGVVYTVPGMDRVRVKKDVAAGDLHFDLYLPTGGGKPPLVVFANGVGDFGDRKLK